MITLDGCYRNTTSPLAKFFLNHDRGRYVRFEQNYVKLISKYFSINRVFTDSLSLRIPYSVISIDARAK